MHLCFLVPGNFNPGAAVPIYETLKARWTEAFVEIVEKLPALLVICLIAFLLMRVVHFLTNRLRGLSRQSQIASTSRAAQIRTMASVRSAPRLQLCRPTWRSRPFSSIRAGLR